MTHIVHDDFYYHYQILSRIAFPQKQSNQQKNKARRSLYHDCYGRLHWYCRLLTGLDLLLLILFRHLYLDLNLLLHCFLFRNHAFRSILHQSLTIRALVGLAHPFGNTIRVELMSTRKPLHSVPRMDIIQTYRTRVVCPWEL